MEHRFGIAVCSYAKGWYNSQASNIEKHSDLQNLKLILAYYSALDPKMVTNKDVIYSTFIVVFPIIKELSEHTVYRHVQDLLYVWDNYKISQHCSLEDFGLEKFFLTSMLSILKLTPVVNQKFEVDQDLASYIIKYYRTCECHRCRLKV